MKQYTIDQYRQAGCPEMSGGMLAVHSITGGRVCDTGCSAFEGGRCKHYQKLTGSETIRAKYESSSAETVRDEAKRRGVSIAEVRRGRREKLNQGNQE